MKEMIAFQQERQSILTTEFISDMRKAEMLRVLNLGMTGPNTNSTPQERRKVKVTLLQDVQCTAHLLDPHQYPENDAPFQMRLHRHIYSYCQGQEDRDSSDVRRRLLQQYSVII